MPQFSPGEAKTAIAPITVSPSGLSCEAELFLGPDELTKVATSGRRPFSSTGASQSVRLPITMPSAEGTYHAYIDVYAGGLLIAAYQAIEDVVIAAPVTPVLGGQILYSKWRETGTTQWRSWPLSVPAYTAIDILWHIRNDSNCRASFVTNTGTLDPLRFFTIHSDASVTLDPGEEADLVHIGYQGEKSGTSGTMTWHLAVQAGEVISTYGPDWYYTAKIVDSVTLKFSWY